jgi:proline iminopeptidase
MLGRGLEVVTTNGARVVRRPQADMVTAARRLIVSITIGFCASTAQGQAPHDAGKSSVQQEGWPRLHDWFLSTGRWSEDPQLYVREYGRGPRPIILLHGGWGAEHSGLVDAVKGLEDHYHFILYDQRGSLRSPSPDSLITFDRHIEDLELLRKELKLERLSIVGHSMGAVLASAYAAKYPQRVEHLTLVAPAYLKSPIPAEDKDLHHRSFVASQAFLARPEVMQELDRFALNRKDSPLTSREETARFRIDLARRMLYDIRNWPRLLGGRALYNGRVDELTSRTYPAAGWDFVQAFASSTYPVGILAADHDFLDMGNELLKKWVAPVPRIQLSVIKNAGHLIWLDQPEAFTNELRRHLESGRADGEGRPASSER